MHGLGDLQSYTDDIAWMQIYQVIKSRQPTYLADPDWTKLPWKSIPKTPIDQLLDKTAALANLFVQGSEIESLESTSLLRASLGIVSRCWKIEAELRQFYEDLERANRGPLYWPKFSTESNPADDAKHGKVFPVAFQFLNLKMAFTFMIYWASLILVWAVLTHVYQLLGNLQLHNIDNDVQADGCCCQVCSNDDSSHETCSCGARSPTAHAKQLDVDQLPPVEPRIDVLSAARNICQSVEYCMQEEMKGLGTTSTVIPLMAVIDVLPSFPHCSRELAWAKAAFEKINGRGFRLMSYLDKE